jgi:triosephosphate isomerase
VDGTRTDSVDRLQILTNSQPHSHTQNHTHNNTGLVCEADKANDVHKFIRSVLEKMYDKEVAEAMRIQYGGSVTDQSVDELMSQSDIDGCLVGGASLFADKFSRIVNFQLQV